MIEISLNSERVNLPPETPLNEALRHWEYADHPVAVAINGEFVARANYAQTRLNAGDLVDVVRPVGGG